ncbi:Negative regulator of genetic competence clpC/mecB [Borrelia parkeri SLO]|uniref:Negative regulator of genetic competence clpC/mecB n=1 Tax=Borrelia parkeri SLO TaxID=1313294 RepID=A0ABM5PID8_BORPR|nr:ATP-dependent Clp protease ATP-binding subunit [Borrelia parkeri]AHH09086.1 Negative regulator of genetic competence clpC/mecB [Borrelia parkeri SLO]
MSILVCPKKSEIKKIDTKTLKNIKQDTLCEIEKLEKVLIGTNEIIIPKINREIFILIEQTKKEFKSKTSIGIKEIFYQILKTKKLLKKYKLNKLSFNFNEENMIASIDKIRLIETYKEFEDEIRLTNDYFEIDKYVKNLTKLAKEKKLNPLIGREKEIQSLINILERRNKNSTILIGEPGVGKTAIVEGLAIKIANKEIKNKLQNKVILQIDTSDLVSGTKYRGEFEERLNNIIKSIKNNKDIIIFIDEIHTLIGAGNSEGSIDAANILKPVLSRSAIQIIGATTYDEYRKHISQDKAFTRRFQTISIKEPDEKETLNIINNIIKNFEDYHGVTYEKEAIENVIKISSQYLINKRFPDKAIDLIDIAGAQKKQKETNEKIINVEDIKSATDELLNIKIKSNIKEEIDTLKTEAIHIKEKIIGQECAINEIIIEMVKTKLEINNNTQPLTSILLIGSSGSGKTMIAKTISSIIIEDQNSILKLDMSDYREETSISKLIGTNPGYTGYADGGILTNRLKHNPRAFIILENIEHAHNSVLTIIEQILEHGELISSKEDKISFKNTIIVLSTSIGTKTLLGKGSIGFKKTDNNINIKNEINNELKTRFKSSLLDKIQKKIILNILKEEDLSLIYNNYCKELTKKFRLKNIKIEIDDNLKNHIINKYYDKNSGARSVLNAIKEQIEEKIINQIFKNPNINLIKIYLDQNNIKIKQKEILCSRK